MTKCILGLHENVQDVRQLEALTPCFLFANAPLTKNGIREANQCCVHCCIRISQLLEARRELLMRGILSIEDEEATPDTLIQYLSEPLVPFAKVMLKAAGSFSEAERECVQCSNRAWLSAPRYAPSIEPEKATRIKGSRR